MGKFDSFFSQEPSSELNSRVLKSAAVELELNRIARKRRRLFAFLAPLTAALASFFVFKVVVRKESDLMAMNIEQLDFITVLIEDEDTFEIIDNLALLEELEIIEEFEGEDV